MTRVESRFSGLGCEAILERGIDVWPAVDREIKRHAIDLIVLGTRGRTGTKKLLFGSVAEEIFRRSPVPVLTIGPGVRSAVHKWGAIPTCVICNRFQRRVHILPPLTLSRSSGKSRFVFFYCNVMPRPDSRNGKEDRRFELSVAEALQKLYDYSPEGC